MKTTLEKANKITSRKIYVVLFAGICLIAATSQAQVLFSENFDAMTTGVNPTGFTVNLPASPTPGTLESTVVPFGGGNGLRLLDQSGTGNAQVQQDFTPGSSAHLSLFFTRNQNIVPVNTTYGLFVSLGTYGGNQPSAANRAFAIRIFNDGTFTFERGAQDLTGNFTGTTISSGLANYEPTGSTTFSTHTLDIFAYSGTTGGSGLSYVGPDSITRTLAAKSYSVFVDNVLVTSLSDSLGGAGTGNYGFAPANLYAGAGDLGRLGLVTGGATARTGMDFTVDNITVSVIPEPSTLALLALGFAVAGGRISRRRFGAGK